jgi:hypothetical protein
VAGADRAIFSKVVPSLRRGAELPSLQNEPAEICVLGEIADVFLDIVGVDLDGFAVAVGSCE